jgi:hypothetical protein
MDALIALFDDYFVNYSVFGNKLILIENDMSCDSLILHVCIARQYHSGNELVITGTENSFGLLYVYVTITVLILVEYYGSSPNKGLQNYSFIILSNFSLFGCRKNREHIDQLTSPLTHGVTLST